MGIDQNQDGNQSKGVTRRGFLSGIGVGAAGAALPAEALAQQPQARVPTRPDRFGRLFDLRPFAEGTPQVQRALIELGAPRGILDAQDPLHEGPVRLITNPELSPRNVDNPASTAGVTFLGQFLDHDMTFDTTSRLGVATRPERSPNTRTPALDLDSVYGGGPTADLQLYDQADRAKFRVESGGRFEDLPRASDGTAIIADPRNDENLMIAGLQVAMLLFLGARIVGEVFLGLLALDPNSYLSQDRRWRPTLPSRVPGTFRMTDLLTFARVDPASRGQ